MSECWMIGVKSKQSLKNEININLTFKIQNFAEDKLPAARKVILKYL